MAKLSFTRRLFLLLFFALFYYVIVLEFVYFIILMQFTLVSLYIIDILSLGVEYVNENGAHVKKDSSNSGTTTKKNNQINAFAYSLLCVKCTFYCRFFNNISFFSQSTVCVSFFFVFVDIYK